MLPSWVLFLFSTGYVASLFAVAFFGDRKARLAGPPSRKPWIYGLALCVYCTSWTFYGAVGRAAASGWDFLPIYLGPVLVLFFGGSLIRRVIRISKRQNITSIADFIGARYGRHQSVAILVTLITVIGVVPYIALQLKAISLGFDVLSGYGGDSPAHMGTFPIAVMLAVFAILFGTRDLVSTENHHGLMLAIAFESLVKLAAFLAVGIYAVYGVGHGFVSSYENAFRYDQIINSVHDTTWQVGFVSQTILAGAAIICLPRQFHVTVVENTALSDFDEARWIFAGYMAVVSIFVIPIAIIGLERIGVPGGSSADTFVLALPLATGHPWLALGAYLGGFSAATGMVIVETIALSTMLCNEVIMPLYFRPQGTQRLASQNLSLLIKRVRRISIVVIIAMAYGYFRLFTGPGTLTQIGLLSFAAVAQFAPGLLGGVIWRKGRYQGVAAGLIAGFLLWSYTLLLPALLLAGGLHWDILDNGPFGLLWLRPSSLFGLSDFDPITLGAFWSLAVNVILYTGVSLLKSPALRERLQSVKFLEDAVGENAPPRGFGKNLITVGDLQDIVARFLGEERTTAMFDKFSRDSGRTSPGPADPAEPAIARFVEHILAGILGNSSARVLLGTTLLGRDMQPEDVVRLLDGTSQAIQISRELLAAALENIPQGVSIVDSELCLVAWNIQYGELFEYPDELLVQGRPIEDLIRFNASRGWLHSTDVDAAVNRRLAHMRAGRTYSHERAIQNGMVLEIIGNPMPGGGFVSTYSDVTAYKSAQNALENANETLESRVTERTSELMGLNLELAAAKLASERANEAKTRFLAAASHDLAQPLTAARLFVSAVDAAEMPRPASSLLSQAEAALTAAEDLLGGLLSISRLDGGAEEAHPEHFPLSRIIRPLFAEFALLAEDKGLELRMAKTDYIAFTDAHLLRRVLQNFLSNAVRYTRSGGILFGCRRRRGSLLIEVWDTGPGIPEDKHVEIFEEFRRLENATLEQERSLGLGLSIAERIAGLLKHEITLRSRMGRGSVFSIEVPRGNIELVQEPEQTVEPCLGDPLIGRCVFCLENDPHVLSGLEALLLSWGCHVRTATDRVTALSIANEISFVPDIQIVDYQLGAETSGLWLAEEVQEILGKRIPTIVITADHTQDAHIQTALRGYELLRKPIKPAALRALATKTLAEAESNFTSGAGASARSRQRPAY